MKKRIWALVLTLAMLAEMLPGNVISSSAYAYDETAGEEIISTEDTQSANEGNGNTVVGQSAEDGNGNTVDTQPAGEGNGTTVVDEPSDSTNGNAAESSDGQIGEPDDDEGGSEGEPDDDYSSGIVIEDNEDDALNGEETDEPSDEDVLDDAAGEPEDEDSDDESDDGAESNTVLYNAYNNVTVSGNLPENAALTVSTYDGEWIIDEENGTIELWVYYDISLGDGVQPNGPVEVTIPVPEDFFGELSVWYIVNGEPVQEMEEVGLSDDGAFYTFITDHFSVYGLRDIETIPDESDIDPHADTFTMLPGGNTQKDVIVNGERRVIYCMQYDNVWPTLDVEGYHNAATKYREADASEMYLTSSQLATIQRVLYAGYPYDAVGALEPLYNEYGAAADDVAADITQAIIWYYMALWNVDGNSHYSANHDHDGDEGWGQSFNLIMEYANSGAALVSPPADFVPSVSGGAITFTQQSDGTYLTGAHQITDPAGFKIAYTVTLPDGVIPLNQNKEPLVASYDFVNGEWVVKDYIIYGGEDFYLQTDDPTALPDEAFMHYSGSAQVPTDVKQYMTTDTAFANKNDGQGYVQHPYQTMLSIGVSSRHYSASALLNTESETIEIEVTKTWEDNNDQDGIRPETITIILYANGVEEDDVEISQRDDGTWGCVFTDLPKYENGVEIEYTVAEADVDGYDSSVDGSMADGFEITNTHVPETITIEGSKTWIDVNNKYEKRPASITIRLYANGVEVGKVMVTAQNGWKWSFTNRDKYENGEEIKYTITEDRVANYTAMVNGYNITNYYYNGEIPQTGDSSNLLLWTVLLAASVCGAAGICAMLIKKRKENC